MVAPTNKVSMLMLVMLMAVKEVRAMNFFHSQQAQPQQHTFQQGSHLGGNDQLQLGGFTFGGGGNAQPQQPSTRPQQQSMSFDMPQGGFTYQPRHQGFFSKVQSQQPSTRSQQPSTRPQQPSTRSQQQSTRPQQTWNRPTF